MLSCDQCRPRCLSFICSVRCTPVQESAFLEPWILAFSSTARLLPCCRDRSDARPTCQDNTAGWEQLSTARQTYGVPGVCTSLPSAATPPAHGKSGRSSTHNQDIDLTESLRSSSYKQRILAPLLLCAPSSSSTSSTTYAHLHRPIHHDGGQARP